MKTRTPIAGAILLAVVALVAAGRGTSPAVAGGPPAWTQITTQSQTLTQQLGLLRVGGKLYVAWAKKAGTKYALMVTPIPAGGVPAAADAVTSGWALIGDPAMVRAKNGGLRIFFNGQKTVNQNEPLDGVNLATAPATGASWTIFPAAIANDTLAHGRTPSATVADDGTFFESWYSATDLVVHRGLDSTTPNFTYDKLAGSPCCSVDTQLVTDDASGAIVAVWCDFSSKPAGIYVQGVNPSTGAASGAKTRLSGSFVVQGGEPQHICDGSDRTAAVAKAGGGVFVASGVGYPTNNKLKVWKVGTAQPTQVGPAGEYNNVALAADPNGRLWVAWSEPGQSGQVIHARRSDASGLQWGPVLTVQPPAGWRDSIYDIEISANGSLDILARLSTTTGTVSVWHTRLKP